MAQATSAKLDYTYVEYPEPHIGRTKKILKAHPEVRELMGRNPWTALWTVMIVGLQFGVAIALSGQPWWMMLLAAFFIGAFADHALFVVIHEATHNLIFKKASANKLMGIVANLSGVFPSAIGFRNYHLLHHRYQGEFNWDADLAGPGEAKFFGNSAFGKAMWFLFFAVIEGTVRPARLKKVKFVEPWTALNLVVTVGCALAVLYNFGWNSFGYLGLSTLFSVGLHPVGGRWIQEHFILKEGQETYSYYGPLNKLSFNVGYHNEHHDFMMVPWNNLPKVRAMAPEFYDTLHYHMSWPGLVIRFIFDKNLSLYSRVVRPDHLEKRKQAMSTRETQGIIDEHEKVTTSSEPQEAPNSADRAEPAEAKDSTPASV